MTITPALLDAILTQYALPLYGVHGIAHWARVLENGRRLAAVHPARLPVVELFAVFHDSRRRSEGIDFGHGQRGAELAAKLRGQAFELDDADFALLYDACAHHTDGRTEADITLQVCWDSDRLDLSRVGITPRAGRLCTQAARDPVLLNWAVARADNWFIPDLIQSEWGRSQDPPRSGGG